MRYPGAFSPLDNWLSDLGNPLANPSGAVFYNAGCIITGLELVGFYLGLGQWPAGGKKARVLLSIGQAAGIVSSFCLVLAAVFPLGAHTSLHAFWSKMLSVFMGFFLTFSATALMRHPRFMKWIAYYAYLTALVNFIYGVFLHDVFVAEWIAIGMFIIYVLLVAFNARALTVETSHDTP